MCFFAMLACAVSALESSTLDSILARLKSLESENVALRNELNAHAFKFNLPENERESREPQVG